MPVDCITQVCEEMGSDFCLFRWMAHVSARSFESWLEVARLVAAVAWVVQAVSTFVHIEQASAMNGRFFDVTQMPQG